MERATIYLVRLPTNKLQRRSVDAGAAAVSAAAKPSSGGDASLSSHSASSRSIGPRSRVSSSAIVPMSALVFQIIENESGELKVYVHDQSLRESNNAQELLETSGKNELLQFYLNALSSSFKETTLRELRVLLKNLVEATTLEPFTEAPRNVSSRPGSAALRTSPTVRQPSPGIPGPQPGTITAQAFDAKLLDYVEQQLHLQQVLQVSGRGSGITDHQVILEEAMQGFLALVPAPEIIADRKLDRYTYQRYLTLIEEFTTQIGIILPVTPQAYQLTPLDTVDEDATRCQEFLNTLNKFYSSTLKIVNAAYQKRRTQFFAVDPNARLPQELDKLAGLVELPAKLPPAEQAPPGEAVITFFNAFIHEVRQLVVNNLDIIKRFLLETYLESIRQQVQEQAPESVLGHAHNMLARTALFVSSQGRRRLNTGGTESSSTSSLSGSAVKVTWPLIFEDGNAKLMRYWAEHLAVTINWAQSNEWAGAIQAQRIVPLLTLPQLVATQIANLQIIPLVKRLFTPSAPALPSTSSVPRHSQPAISLLNCINPSAIPLGLKPFYELVKRLNNFPLGAIPSLPAEKLQATFQIWYATSFYQRYLKQQSSPAESLIDWTVEIFSKSEAQPIIAWFEVTGQGQLLALYDLIVNFNQTIVAANLLKKNNDPHKHVFLHYFLMMLNEHSTICQDRILAWFLERLQRINHIAAAQDVSTSPRLTILPFIPGVLEDTIIEPLLRYRAALLRGCYALSSMMDKKDDIQGCAPLTIDELQPLLEMIRKQLQACNQIVHNDKLQRLRANLDNESINLRWLTNLSEPSQAFSRLQYVTYVLQRAFKKLLLPSKVLAEPNTLLKTNTGSVFNVLTELYQHYYKPACELLEPKPIIHDLVALEPRVLYTLWLLLYTLGYEIYLTFIKNADELKKIKEPKITASAPPSSSYILYDLTTLMTRRNEDMVVRERNLKDIFSQLIPLISFYHELADNITSVFGNEIPLPTTQIKHVAVTPPLHTNMPNFASLFYLVKKGDKVYELCVLGEQWSRYAQPARLITEAIKHSNVSSNVSTPPRRPKTVAFAGRGPSAFFSTVPTSDSPPLLSQERDLAEVQAMTRSGSADIEGEGVAAAASASPPTITKGATGNS